MKLDEKALESAVSHWRQNGNLADAIRAYLEAATPPDVAGLVRKIDAVTNRVTCDFDSRDELLSQAATALRLSAGGGVPEEPWREIRQHVQPRIADGYTAVMISKPGFWFVKGPPPRPPPWRPAMSSELVERLEVAAQWDSSPSQLIHEAIARIEALEAALDAVEQHENSNFYGPDADKNRRASWRGVMRKVRAARRAREGGNADG